MTSCPLVFEQNTNKTRENYRHNEARTISVSGYYYFTIIISSQEAPLQRWGPPPVVCVVRIFFLVLIIPDGTFKYSPVGDNELYFNGWMQELSMMELFSPQIPPKCCFNTGTSVSFLFFKKKFSARFELKVG